MKNSLFLLKCCLLAGLLCWLPNTAGAVLMRCTHGTAGGGIIAPEGPDATVSRTYFNNSSQSRQGASSWKWSRRQRAANQPVNKSAAVEITYADFLSHLAVGQDRSVQIFEAGTVSMDVGEEDVTGAVWNMPNLGSLSGTQTSTYNSLDLADTEDDQYFDLPTHAFQLGVDSYQFLELVPDENGFTGYLDNQGYTDPEYFYEVYSTMTPVPMALGLGVFEGEFGPEPCGFFGDGCTGIEGEEEFTMVQTYEEVATGILNTYDGETSEAIKLRNTDSITIFNASGDILQVVIFDYLIWYSKDGHFLKGLLADGEDWTGVTDFNYFEYQKVSTAALPVEWLAVSAEVIKNREVQVNWSTATESQNERFVVERSVDGESFTPIAELDAAGESQVRQDYSYTDEAPLEGFNYYRIQQQDFNGMNTYSSIVSALITRTAGDEELVVLYPNPGRNEVFFSRPADYELMTIDGQLLSQGRAEQQLNVTELPAGTYLVRIDGGEAYRWVKR